MAAGDTPNRETVLESITVVFSHSKLKDVVGTDALKSVLSGQYRELVSGGTLHLHVIWDLLADQPGFEEEAALAPFCVLKTWESDLGLEVEMPERLAECSATEIIAQASHCPIPKTLKARTLNPQGARDKVLATMAKIDEGSPETSPSTSSSRKPAVEAALAAVAVLGLAYGGYAYYSATGGAEFKAVQTGEIRTDMPIAKAKQLGEELNLLVEEETWYELPSARRKASLRTTLENLRMQKITSLVVQDSSGRVRGSAQWIGSPAKIIVRLQ